MTETIPLSGVSYSLYPYVPFSYREAQHPTFNFYSASFQVCGMHVYPLDILEPHIFSCLAGFPGRSSLNLYYHPLSTVSSLFSINVILKTMACTVPNLIAALGRKSRPTVKGSRNAEKLNKSCHLPHFIQFLRVARRTGWLPKSSHGFDVSIEPYPAYQKNKR